MALMKPKSRFLSPIALLLLGSMATTGCASFAAALPVLVDVIAIVTDAQQILSLIELAAQKYFAAKPNAVLQEKYEKALVKAKLSLDAALRAARGAQELDQKQASAAFEDFRAAYQDLLEVLKEAGVVGVDGALRAAPGGPPQATIPTPMALTMK